MHKIKSAKAAGIDRLRPKMIKYVGDEGTNLLHKRLKEQTEKTLNDTQAAFKINLSIQDSKFILRQIAEKTSTNSKKYTVAVNLEKTFDYIKREEIQKVLDKTVVNKKLMEVIDSVYLKKEKVVRVNGHTQKVA